MLNRDSRKAEHDFQHQKTSGNGETTKLYFSNNKKIKKIEKNWKKFLLARPTRHCLPFRAPLFLATLREPTHIAPATSQAGDVRGDSRALLLHPANHCVPVLAVRSLSPTTFASNIFFSFFVLSSRDDHTTSEELFAGSQAT